MKKKKVIKEPYNKYAWRKDDVVFLKKKSSTKKILRKKVKARFPLGKLCFIRKDWPEYIVTSNTGALIAIIKKVEHGKHLTKRQLNLIRPFFLQGIPCGFLDGKELRFQYKL